VYVPPTKAANYWCKSTQTSNYSSFIAFFQYRERIESRRSTLPLLVLGVRADHEHHTAAADDLAISADLLD